MKKNILPALFLLLAAGFLATGLRPGVALAQSAAANDEAAVHAAVVDYVEALYNVEPDRIARSVSTDLVKFGWFKTNGAYVPAPMSYQQLVNLAGSWNRDNRQNITDETVRDIVVYDVLDKTAVAKLTAQWGIDYFQLEKIDGTWKIRHILWQSHPD
jgi:hypothetical protein